MDPLKPLRLPAFLVVAVGIVLTLLLVLGIFQYAYQFYIKPVTNQTVQIEILSGQTFNQTSDELNQRGLLPSLWYWRVHAQLNAVDTQIQAGEYILTTEDTMATVLDKFITGDAVLYKFTLLEGWNLYQILEAMRNIPELIMSNTDMHEIAEALNIDHRWPEGWFYPDTYFFHKGMNNLKLLSQAHEKMEEKLNFLWQKRQTGLPFQSPYKALILASIVEKESALEAEKRRIAGVFISRLNKNMLLQTDPTVIYGIGEAFDGNITSQDLKTDTPYNTYIHAGLPPTPIAATGESALAAVMNPDISGDLYFVAKGDKSHHFSKTYEEHRQAVKKYQLRKK